MTGKHGSQPVRQLCPHQEAEPDELCAQAHFSLFIQPGTSGHGRVHCHIGWVFLTQLTNLEAPSQTSLGGCLPGGRGVCQFDNQYQPPKLLLREILSP